MERDCFFGVNFKSEKTCNNCIYSRYDFDRHCYVCRKFDELEQDINNDSVLIIDSSVIVVDDRIHLI